MQITIAKIHSAVYPLIILMSFVLAVLFLFLDPKRRGIRGTNRLLFCFFAAVMALIGSKFLTAILSFTEPVSFLNAGMTSYGGALGVIGASVIYEKIVPFQNAYLKSGVLSLPLLYGTAKTACFLTGCCYGLPYDGPFAVAYPERMHGTYVPVQIMETAVFLILFAILLSLDRKTNGKGTVICTVIVCAAAKFLLDFFRFDHVRQVITKNQVISILLVAGVLTVYFISEKKRKQKKEDTSGAV